MSRCTSLDAVPRDHSDKSKKISDQCERQVRERNFYRDSIQNRTLFELEKAYLCNLYMLSMTKTFKSNHSDNYLADLSEETNSSSCEEQKKRILKKRKQNRKLSANEKTHSSIFNESTLLKPQIRNEIFLTSLNEDYNLLKIQDEVVDFSSDLDFDDVSVIDNEPYALLSDLSVNIEQPSRRFSTDFVSVLMRISDFRRIFNNKSTEYDYNPFELAERQFLELLQCDDFKILSEDKTKNNQESSSSLHKKQPTITVSSVPISSSSLIPSIKKSFPKFNFFRKNSSVPKSPSPSPQTSTPCKILSLTKNNLEEHISPIKTVQSFSNDQFEYIDDNASSLNSYHGDNNNYNNDNYCNRKHNDNNHCMNTTAPTETNKLLNADFRGQNDNDNGESGHRVIENGFTDNSDDNNNNRYQDDDVDTHETSSRPQRRQSKFCHECGTRYPIETANFCVECGVRRLLF